VNLDPNLIAISSVVGTLIVSYAHARGYRLPLLEKLLDVVHATPAGPVASQPATSPASSDHPILDALLAEVKAVRAKLSAPPADPVSDLAAHLPPTAVPSQK
jgi:hypothetical protein